jgi:tRNA dimethylallyltransferase
MKKVLIIVGPTASGKSDLSVRLARKFRGEIISADSRQVYKGLDAGTGKITRREMKGVPHYLLDVASPKRVFSVAEYQKLASKKLTEITKRNKLPIIVGGTGFYIDALINQTILPEVPPNKLLRNRLEKLNIEELFDKLKTRDPRRAKEIDKHNKVRLIRALEIIEALGKVPTIQNKKINKNYIFIGLKPEQKDLEKRIYQRILKRLPAMTREAEKLRAAGLSFKRLESLGLEYRYLARLLRKQITKQEFVAELYSEIKKYSKRQMTWFKRNKDIKWFKPSEFKRIEKYARMSLETGD